MEENTLSLILNTLNVGALGVIVYFFIKGQIISKPTLDAMLKAIIENITIKLASDIEVKIERAVENGVVKGYAKMNGKTNESGD